LLLVPPCPQDMGILDWHRHTELADTTYRCGLREMARLNVEGHPALGTGLTAGEPLAASIVAP